jgi:hypothetical protein
MKIRNGRRWIAGITLTLVFLAVSLSLLPARASGGWCQSVGLKVRGQAVIEKTTVCLPPCVYGVQLDLACTAKKRG